MSINKAYELNGSYAFCIYPHSVLSWMCGIELCMNTDDTFLGITLLELTQFGSKGYITTYIEEITELQTRFTQCKYWAIQRCPILKAKKTVADRTPFFTANIEKLTIGLTSDHTKVLAVPAEYDFIILGSKHFTLFSGFAKDPRYFEKEWIMLKLPDREFDPTNMKKPPSRSSRW